MNFKDLSPRTDYYPVILRSEEPLKLDMIQNMSAKDRINNKNSAREGVNEHLLKEYIDNRKGGKIFLKQGVSILGRSVDFFHINRVRNLYLVVEIDEPYRYKGHLPIHYIGNEADSSKEELLLNSGIHIIRFSEKQVVQNAEQCYLVIHHFLAHFTNSFNLDCLKRGSSSEDFIDRKWTEKEARELSVWRYRDNYGYTLEKEIIPINVDSAILTPDSLDSIVNSRYPSGNDIWAGVPTRLFHLKENLSSRDFYYMELINVEVGGILCGPCRITFHHRIKKGDLIERDLLSYLSRQINFGEKENTRPIFPICIIFRWDSNQHLSPKSQVIEDFIALC